MKRISCLLTNLMAVTLLLTACNQEELPEWDGRLYLSSGVATLTRATHGLDTEIAENEKVWLYVDGVTGSEPAHQYYRKELTANKENGFTGADEMYFPAEEESINLYAFHINGPSSMPTDYPTGDLTHKVETDQQSTTGGGYAKSDLLYATVSNTKKEAKDAKGAITLPFKHLLSKIEVVLIKDKSLGDKGISKVEILNTQLQGTFKPSKDSKDISVAPSGEIDAGTSNAILIDKSETTDTDAPELNEAIIIPQTLNAQTAFIRVTLSDDTELTYKLGEATTFVKGQRYRYTITAKLTELTVTATITGWEGESNKYTGETEM
ncbi:fimbrillin family protein [Parabacteroides timonensis]|uniref:fimbrillin family protein n=1 Tax=Parabacteroides timonensis TaxID=1871013 RepID=UPI0013795F0A|nr:fimbrillin family protein [Parabacteroides timonensis]